MKTIWSIVLFLALIAGLIAVLNACGNVEMASTANAKQKKTLDSVYGHCERLLWTVSRCEFKDVTCYISRTGNGTGISCIERKVK